MVDDIKEAAIAASRSNRPPASTDILQWLTYNGPRTQDELRELRKALYGRRTQVGYIVKDSGGDQFTVTGRAGTLFILSDKARHFLLRTLCKMNGTCPRRRR